MRRAKLGGVEFSVLESEDITESATVTSNPVEDGKDISDHVKQESSQLAISGLITGEYARSQFEKLKGYKESGRPVDYIGRERFKNMVIENINRNYDKSNKEGFSFNLSLREVRVTTAKRINIRVSAPRSRARTYSLINEEVQIEGGKVTVRIKPVTNKGRQQVEPKKVVPKAFSPTTIDDTLEPYKEAI